MSRVITSIVTLGTLGAWVALGGQGSDQAFKPFLSQENFQELAKRSKERMAAAKDEKARQTEAPIVAGYGLSVKGAKSTGKFPAVDLTAVMNLLRSKAKGGEGITEELHYSPKLKNQNGIEALINALADKKLSAANAGKVAKELELLADRVAVIGSLTLVHGPGDKKKNDVKVWNEQSATMRDAAIELAEAAKKKDAAAIHEASKRLENTCVECHSVFK